MNRIINQLDTCISNVEQRKKLENFVNSTITGQRSSKIMVLYGTDRKGISTFVNYFTNSVGENKFSILPSNILTRKYTNVNLNTLEDKNLIVFQEIDDDTKIITEIGIIKELL